MPHYETGEQIKFGDLVESKVAAVASAYGHCFVTEVSGDDWVLLRSNTTGAEVKQRDADLVLIRPVLRLSELFKNVEARTSKGRSTYEHRIIASLYEHLGRRYTNRHGNVHGIKAEKKLFGTPGYYEVVFADGYVAALSRDDLGRWYRSRRPHFKFVEELIDHG